MAKQFTFSARIDTSKIAQDTNQIRQLISAAFAPVDFRLPALPTTEIDRIKASFGDLENLNITRPIDELQKELAETEAQIKKLDAELNNSFIKGGGVPQRSQQWSNALDEYFDKVDKEFDTATANRIRASGNIRLGDVQKQFINDEAAPDQIGRTQNAFKELEEKKRFTVDEQRKQLELESQLETQRVQAIQLQRAISRQEYQQLERQIAALSASEQDNGGRELLANAYQEYEATSRNLVEQELKSVQVIEDRKKRIAELDARVQKAPTPTADRVTALTVTKQSVDNAEKLTEALKQAAEAQEKLADATKRTSSARSDTGLQFERERLEIQRRNAQVAQQLVEQEKTAGAARRAEIEKEIAARREAAHVSGQTARAEANERSIAARTASAETIEQERRTTAGVIEEQKRRTAEFRTELRKQEAVPQQQAVADAGVQRQEQILQLAQQQLSVENEKRNIALNNLSQQIALSNQLARVRLDGEREVARVSEQRRQRELADARSKGAGTAQLEIQHARERVAEEKKLLAVANEAGRIRLQNEFRLEQVSSRSAIARLRGESQVAAAAERTAQAQLRAAQVAVNGATNEQQRVAAQERVAAAVQQVIAAEQRRKEVTDALAAEAVSAERRIADATERASVDRVQAEARVQEAKRKTAQVSNQTANAGTGGGTAGLLSNINKAANLLTGGFAAVATVQLVRQIGNAVSELDRLRVEATRGKVSLDILSGSSENAATRIAAIQQAGNGTINTLTAMHIGLQGAALGLADTTGEFERLTTAARSVTLVSPVIRDINGALAEISLAGANQSFRRLDQLGLGVQEVKDRIKELQDADSSLSDQQAFSAAIVDVLNSKYGALLKTTEAQASGQEKLTTAFADFRTELSKSDFIKAYDNALKELADSLERLRALTSEDITFFGSLQGAQAELEKITLGIEKADSTWTKLKKSFGGDLETPFVESPFKKENIEAAIPLYAEIEKLQKNGVVGADVYNAQLRELVATIRLNEDATKNYASDIFALTQEMTAAAEVMNGNSEASDLYADAQKFLGKEFVASSEDAKGLFLQLAKVQSQYEFDRNTKKYIANLENIRLGFYHLKQAANEYNTELDAKKRVEVIGDAESELVRALENEAAQLIEKTGKYEEVQRNLREQKQFIADEIAKIPSDINPDDIPLIVARIKFEIDNQDLQNLDRGGGGSLINAQIIKELQGVAEEANREAREKLRDAKAELLSAVQERIVGFISDGLDPEVAKRQIEIYSKSIENFFKDIPQGIDPTDLDIALAEYGNRLEFGLQNIQDRVSATDISPEQAVQELTDALANLNNAAGDGIPGIQRTREDANDLLVTILQTGAVTKDQIVDLNGYVAIANAAGGATSFYAQAINALGFEFFNNNEQASGLINRMINLDAAYQHGIINSGNYAGQLSVLMKALYDTALQAGVTKDVLDRVFSSANVFVAGNSTKPDFNNGVEQGRSFSRFLSLIQDMAKRDKARGEAEKAANRAQKEAAQSLKDAARNLEKSLEKVPGLFSSSKVTQEQLDLAAAGIPQNFADDFVRRLRDVVENGVNRSDASVGQAKQALNNINIQTDGLTDKQVLALIEKAWNDNSLFASDENLSLLNVDAVKASLDLQEKQEEGKQNIVDYLAKTFDVNLAALTGGEVAAGTPTGAGVATAGQKAAIQAQQPAQLALSLNVDDTAINAAATKSAQLFEKVFREYDFSTLANAPIDAMAASFADNKTIGRVGGLGATMADMLRGGFEKRVTEVEWINSVVSAIENEVTGNVTTAVLSALAN